ncbi:MAG: hypothetical protein AAF962_13540 [Actinomycetota bacterium]
MTRTTNTTPPTRLAALLTAVTLLGSACSLIGGDDTDTAAGTAVSEPSATDAAAAPATEGAEAAAPAPAAGVTASIPWVAPDGMTLTASAVSPDGQRVALAFAGQPGLEAVAAEVVEYDIASGAEAWRVPIEDGGLFGPASLIYTDNGISTLLIGLDGNRLITTSGPAIAAEIGEVTPDVCAQHLNGTVDAAANVSYTVIPSGFCRFDLTSGAFVQVSADELVEGGVISDSIRYDDAGNLVATVSDDDFVTHFLVVDPNTLQPTGEAGAEPPSGADLYGDLLEEGATVAVSSETRVAQTADRSVTAIVQPDRIDVVVS